MENLRNLYLDMLRNGQTVITFHCDYNNTNGFSCIFMAEECKKILYISSLGDNVFTLKIIIKDDFSIELGFIENDVYRKLCKYLDIHFNPDNPFKPKNFVMELDNDIPNAYRVPAYRECIAAISRANYCNDEDKIYFAGWKCWKKKTTSDENMERSASLVGFENALKFQKNNISSCWSSSENEERLDLIDQWLDLLDE